MAHVKFYCLQSDCLDADGIADLGVNCPCAHSAFASVVAGQIVRHAKQWTVKVNACHRQMMDEALDQIRGFPLLT